MPTEQHIQTATEVLANLKETPLTEIPEIQINQPETPLETISITQVGQIQENDTNQIEQQETNEDDVILERIKRLRSEFTNENEESNENKQEETAQSKEQTAIENQNCNQQNSDHETTKTVNETTSSDDTAQKEQTKNAIVIELMPGNNTITQVKTEINENQACNEIKEEQTISFHEAPKKRKHKKQKTQSTTIESKESKAEDISKEEFQELIKIAEENIKNDSNTHSETKSDSVPVVCEEPVTNGCPKNLAYYNQKPKPKQMPDECIGCINMITCVLETNS